MHDETDWRSRLVAVNPLRLLEAARKAVPAVNYALGSAGVAVAGALLALAVGSNRTGIILLAGTFVAMILLFVFSRMIALKSRSVNAAGALLLWSVVIFFTAFLLFTVTAFAFQIPRGWAKFIGAPIDPDPIEKTALTPKQDVGQKKWELYA